MSTVAEPPCCSGEPAYTHRPPTRLSAHIQPQKPRQNRQHQRRPFASLRPLQKLTTRTLRRQRHPPLLEGRLLCTLSPQHPGNARAALPPRNARTALLPSSPISPITHCPSGTDAHNTPARTPTHLPSHICICPNDVIVCWAPTATTTQAASHSAAFTKRHRTATGTQPKSPRHTHKEPKTVRRSSQSCHYCSHVCKTAMSLAKSNALAESKGESRRRVHLHSIHWPTPQTPNQIHKTANIKGGDLPS